MARVRIDLHTDSTVRVAPDSYLDRGLFGSYLTACKVGRASYAPTLRCQLAPRESFGELVAALNSAGFEVSVDQRIAAEIAAQVEAAKVEQAQHAEVAQTAMQRLEAAVAESGLRLYPFQVDGVRWLAPRVGALLADEMGLGKTVQALMALPENAPVVVICPAAVKNVWYRECRRWRPDLFPIVLKGRDSFRWPLPGQLLITNYDILPAAVLTATGEEPKPRTRVQRSDMQAKTAWVCKPGTIVVADEAHALKTKGTKRTQRFGVISDQARRNDGRCWLLTGTPMLNRPDELWQVFEAAGLAGEAFGTWRRFQHLFGWYGGNNARPTAELPGVLRRVMLHRRRTEVLPDLPTKTYQSIEVNGLSDEVKALCDLLVAKLAENGIDLSRADEVVDLVKLQEVAFELIAKVRAALATAKIPSLVELVEGYEEQEEPLVVFSAHRAPVDTLGKRPGWASITGDTSQDERARLVDRFQAGELKGLAITIKAGGVGLTLTHAHVALFCDLEWTPALNAQAEDRICRIGQDRGVIVQRLIATHVIDEKLTTILHRKQQLISQSVERAAVTDLADMPGDEPIVMPTFVSHDTAAYQRAPEAGKPHDPTTNPAPNVLPNRREPATAMERWAANGLVTVAACDPDHATTLNSIGFSKMDNDFGHSLAAQFERFGVLSEKQWAAAVKLATRYRRQIGTPPVDQDEPDTARD